ncbi:MAG: NUDIX hydrolase [Chloroflexota bacterium]
MKPIENWQKLDSQVLADFHVFRLRQDTSRSPRTGQSHNFFVLDTADWINVIPITPEGQVVLIHQFRHGVEAVTLEVPGGMVHPDDPSPAVSAARELMEETGYQAEAIIPIGTVAPNPAILSNRCHSFLALNVRPAGPIQLDSAEDIAIELVNVQEIPELIASGRIDHALVIAAFYFYESYQQQVGGGG